ncbi:MAG: GNAT family N-acetyltransferase [Marinilabiliales bacterium]|nr:MAG: GNAT family N-acetyltransferase [Marinilabiliales bacterium]
MYKIQSLKDKSFDALYESFQDAFADYEMQVNKEELERMLIRRGFVPELSFGAFDGDKLVAFTFNGIGKYCGIETAYDTGTGTMKDYRGKGLATQIFEYSIPFLIEAGIKQYLLEVLQHNTKAVSLYQKLGFEITREFNYFSQEVEAVQLSVNNTELDYKIKDITLTQIESLAYFFDFNPAWQNSFESIFRKPEEFKAFADLSENIPVGFCVTEIKSGDITQIAVNHNHRRNGIGTLLLNEALKVNLHNSVKCINTSIGCDSITRFLESFSIPVAGKQYEMIKKI